MKQYTVEITNEALADMEQLYNHIAYILQAPENAMNQYNRIADAILTLDTMAERIRIMESEPERAYSAKSAHPFRRNGAPFRLKLSNAQLVN